MSARLSVAPPFSPRLIQAWNTFSRRSRRAENCRKPSHDERASVMAYLPGWPRSSAAARAAARAKSGRPARSPSSSTQRVSLLVRQHVLPELGAEARQPLVDGREPVLRRLVERGAGPHETGVVAVEHARLLGVKTERLAPAIELGDAGIERAVEIERVAVAGEQRRDVALDRLDGVAGIGAGQHEEHVGDAVERAPAPSPAPRWCCRSSAPPDWRRWRRSRRGGAASARSKAGRKCSGPIAPNGGRPKAPVQSVSSGFWRRTIGRRSCASIYGRSAFTRATPAAR